MSIYEENVKRGIALLDEKKPDWLKSIDETTLDLGHCQMCILGQVFTDYAIGKHNFGIEDTESAAYYGFNVYDHEDPRGGDYAAGYKVLNAEWITQLKILKEERT